MVLECHFKGPVNIYLELGPVHFKFSVRKKSMWPILSNNKKVVISRLRMKKSCRPFIVLLKNSISPIVFLNGPNSPINTDRSRSLSQYFEVLWKAVLHGVQGSLKVFVEVQFLLERVIIYILWILALVTVQFERYSQIVWTLLS